MLPASSLAQNTGASNPQAAPANAAPATTAPAGSAAADENQTDESQTDENQAAPAAAPPATPLPVKYSPEGFPILQDGTPIRLRLTRTLSSADCKVGDRIDFEVEDPVILDGVTVVPQGTIAWGTVTEAEHKKRMTRGGKLAIGITEVQMANLQKAKLRADSEAKGGGHTGVMAGAMVGSAVVFWPVAPVFLLMHGKEAKIPEGTEVTAYVDGDTVFVPAAGAPPPAAAQAPPQTAPAQPAAATPPPPQTVQAPSTQSPAEESQQQPTPADAAGAELTLTSTPDGADVEVDGAFVGSTPSTIPIANGEHAVRVSKRGYLPYERRLRVNGGSISVHADLEAGGNPAAQ
ncbi:MAG: PEGA domain-containing protein [Candidatus Korobacteraceae bacterium]